MAPEQRKTRSPSGLEGLRRREELVRQLAEEAVRRREEPEMELARALGFRPVGLVRQLAEAKQRTTKLRSEMEEPRPQAEPDSERETAKELELATAEYIPLRYRGLVRQLAEVSRPEQELVRLCHRGMETEWSAEAEPAQQHCRAAAKLN